MNTNLGGDNTNRGSTLGALLGAIHGKKAIPQRWIDNLARKSEIESDVKHFTAALL